MIPDEPELCNPGIIQTKLLTAILDLSPGRQSNTIESVFKAGPKRMKNKILYLNLYVGLIGLATSAILLAFGLPFMKAWFYCFAWWSFLLIMDSVNVRSWGTSPLCESGFRFLSAAFLSVPVWLAFELFNLRLKNWSYHGLPQSLPERWLGYFIAFATVIPAVWELAVFFQGYLKDTKATRFRLPIGPFLLRFCFITGVIFLALSLAWPRFFFPLVWLGFIFLLEPVNCRRHWPSFLADLENCRASRLASWALAGLAAGLVWELLNFWAGSHWEYAVPHFSFWKIFQMPVLGYGGFIPFGLEVFAAFAFLDSFYQGIRRKPLWRAFFWAGLLAFDLFCFFLIDNGTVL
jgi:hypothetical protein